MELKNKNILLISPEPWDHLPLSKHHYAIHLAERGNRVFFMNPPERKTPHIQVNTTKYDGLKTVDYKGFVKGMRFLPKVIQKKMMSSKLKQISNACHVDFDLVWSFDNSVFFNFDGFSKNIFCISHIVDFNQNFNRSIAAKTANICLAISQPIYDVIHKYNNNTHIINHGYSANKNVKKISRLPGNNNVKCFFAGNLDNTYLDWKTLIQSIDLMPTVDFIFSGPWHNSERKIELDKKSNFYYSGVLSSDQVQNYYKSVDVLLNCKLYQDHPKQLTNAHKITEYLGSGQVIVSSWIQDFANKNLIEMTQSAEEFPSLLQSVVEHLDYHNAENKRKERIEFAQNNTYDKQIQTIENYINRL